MDNLIRVEAGKGLDAASIRLTMAIWVRHNDRRRSGDDLLGASPICGGLYRAIGQQFIQNRDIRALRFHEVHALHRQCEI